MVAMVGVGLRMGGEGGDWSVRVRVRGAAPALPVLAAMRRGTATGEAVNGVAILRLPPPGAARTPSGAQHADGIPVRDMSVHLLLLRFTT